MNRVVVTRPNAPGCDPHLFRSMYRFRHKVFHDNLGWEVASNEGLEHDHFDKLDPVYMISGDYRQVEGCWRLLPTSGPYMLKDTFPQLLRGTHAPQAEEVWEISRFAVLPSRTRSRSQANICSITFDLLRAGVDFADQNGIKHYVFVTSVAVERLLQRAGLTLHRMGDGKAQRVGKVLSVACWIDIDDATRRAVYQGGQLHGLASKEQVA